MNIFGLRDKPDTSKWTQQDKLAIYQWDRVENSDYTTKDIQIAENYESFVR